MKALIRDLRSSVMAVCGPGRGLLRPLSFGGFWPGTDSVHDKANGSLIVDAKERCGVRSCWDSNLPVTNILTHALRGGQWLRRHRFGRRNPGADFSKVK